MDALAEFEAYVAKLDDKDKAELDRLIEPELKALWLPDPRNQPQVKAYYSLADVMLYGGSPGGGKSDLLVGLALTAHARSVIFRRQSTDLGDIEERIIQIAGRDGWNGADKVLRRADRLVELGHLEKPGSEMTWQGGLGHDFIGFDEGAQLPRHKVQFVLGWLRSVDPNQRRRTVIASNPPLGAEGYWLVEWFAPWLDPGFPNPAQPGELRWAVTAPNKDGTTVWLDSGESVTFESEIDHRKSTPDEIAQAERGENAMVAKPMTRTFIPSKLRDNPYLANTGYLAQIQSMPEPMRTRLLTGDFLAGRDDDEFQIIPTAWIEAAQKRWTSQPPRGARMTALAVDIAQGGADKTVVAARYGGWFAPLDCRPGRETREGADVLAAVVRMRRDACPVIIDAGGGWGTEAAGAMERNGIPVVSYLGLRPSLGVTREGNLKFANKRAESWWRMREELDPDQEGGSVIALPPQASIKADLAAPRFKIVTDTRGIQVEEKKDIIKRLGRSPDEGDAIVMCLSEGAKAAAKQLRESRRGARPERANVGHAAMKERFR